jgi:predicted HTH transcriptional regulator
MDSNLLTILLNENESTSLDFKRDQYPFVGATDDEKSELLKDILAFTNAWRHADAYILIGVDEKQDNSVVGVSAHFDDASLQQFVNSKTQRKTNRCT